MTERSDRGEKRNVYDIVSVKLECNIVSSETS